MYVCIDIFVYIYIYVCVCECVCFDACLCDQRPEVQRDYIASSGHLRRSDRSNRFVSIVNASRMIECVYGSLAVLAVRRGWEKEMG